MTNLAARDRFAALAAATPAVVNIETADETRTARVHLYGVVGGYWGGIDAAELVPNLRDLDVDTLEVFINSPGGDVYDGIAIRNALRQHPARVVATIDGLAASAASFIACAADEVVMGENAEFMIHDAWSIAVGNAADMRDSADDLDRISDNIAAMYASKAGGDASDWRELMKAETWYSAEEAVASGLADRLDSADTEAHTADLFDLSMYAHAGRSAASAPLPAAALAAPRKEASMTGITREALDQALANQSEEFGRTLDVRLSDISASAGRPAGPVWPTAGAFLKDLASGSEPAMQFYTDTLAAYDGATTADDKQPNTWIADAIHLINRNRKVLNSFTVEPLPEDGMTLEYLVLKENSISVEKQESQGADLVKGKIELDSKTTPIETYGGWTEVSQQLIKRGNAAWLTTANRAMDLEYARATEAVVRDLLKGILAAQLAGTDHPLTIAANATAYAWLDLVVDASMLFEDRGYTLDGAYVSADVFKKLIRLEDGAKNSLFQVWGQGYNQVGELDLRNVKGNLASVEFRILPDAVDGTLEFHDRIGITTWEEPGAPFRLQDQNIVNLTEAFSKYGNLAAASQFPDAIQHVKIGA
jgi:uncharacterized protein